MSAVSALQSATAAGVSVTVDGSDLVLSAPNGPPPELIDLFRRNKAEIITLLHPRGWGADDWIAFYHERAGIAEYDGGASRAEAEARAFEACVTEWLTQHHEPTPPEECALCRKPNIETAVVVPFGTAKAGYAWLHADCWAEWYQAKRNAAIDDLVRITGLPTPNSTERSK